MTNLQKIKQLLYTRSMQLDRSQVEFACGILNKSGVIALPTDTLYGLAARACDSKALEKIYKIKGRDAAKPLSVCVANISALDEVAEVKGNLMKLLNCLLPGPVTIILKRSPNLNKDLNPNIDTIGVRIPCHNFVIALCDQLGPLALTSANKSGEENPLVVEDFKEIWDELDCVFDAGSIKTNVIRPSYGISVAKSGSTVIDLTDDNMKYYKIIREGCALNRSINILTRFGYRNQGN